jgi:hypothetical protein
MDMWKRPLAIVVLAVGLAAVLAVGWILTWQL